MKNNLFWTGFFALVSVFRERKLPMAEKKELAVTEEKVVEIEMERLRSFENHPFKVRADSQMIELQESVKKYGILNPLIVRPRKDGTYEIISGHRRKFAAKKIILQTWTLWKKQKLMIMRMKISVQMNRMKSKVPGMRQSKSCLV